MVITPNVCVVFFLFCFLPSSGCKALQFFEDTHSISSSLNNICLRENILGKDLDEDEKERDPFNFTPNKVLFICAASQGLF